MAARGLGNDLERWWLSHSFVRLSIRTNPFFRRVPVRPSEAHKRGQCGEVEQQWQGIYLAANGEPAVLFRGAVGP